MPCFHLSMFIHRKLPFPTKLCTIFPLFSLHHTANDTNPHLRWNQLSGTWSDCFGQKLKRQPFLSIGQINLATSGKSNFFQHMLHRKIILVSINPQISMTVLCAPVDAERTSPLHTARRCHPVHDMICSGPNPASLINLCIIRIGSL